MKFITLLQNQVAAIRDTAVELGVLVVIADSLSMEILQLMKTTDGLLPAVEQSRDLQKNTERGTKSTEM